MTDDKTDQAVPDDIKTKTTREILHCKLTEAERLDRHDQIFRILQQADEIEASKKTAMEEHKARLSALKSKLCELRGVIDRGSEPRPVDCVIEHDYKAKQVRKRRLDTGEVYEKRVMTEGELQVSLLPDHAAQEKAKGDDKPLSATPAEGGARVLGPMPRQPKGEPQKPPF